MTTSLPAYILGFFDTHTVVLEFATWEASQLFSKLLNSPGVSGPHDASGRYVGPRMYAWHEWAKAKDVEDRLRPE